MDKNQIVLFKECAEFPDGHDFYLISLTGLNIFSFTVFDLNLYLERTS